ncbi:cell division protein FtsQ/DivIB [Quadrisphaera granulorum]|uniref:cell division protein FtsQ/DivIB n=1 Tax=Quadrisphaera granulorum TaxID=317664 RepID=UPI0014738987|nr:FtsQ-type POTRA domain-containing protein [Quadrisphaera granulorum]
MQLPETGPAAPQSAAHPASSSPAVSTSPVGSSTQPGVTRQSRSDTDEPGRPPQREGRAERPRAAGATEGEAARSGSSSDGAGAGSGRRLLWRVIAVAVVVVLLLGAAAWALLASSLTALRDVRVSGADRTGAAAVQSAAADQMGLPLLRVDTGAVSERLRKLPWVASVSVTRGFPHRLDVAVTEKVPVAAVPAADGAPGVMLLDGDGTSITTADAAPEGVPLVQVDPGAAGAGAVRAASAVALALPTALREQVSAITASGPEDVRLALRDGKQVVWGGAGEDDLKARVAQLLLPREGVRTVDVSAPRAPATAP